MNNSKRLSNRIWILQNLDSILKESIYYRTHSEEFESYNKIVVGKIDCKELKKKII